MKKEKKKQTENNNKKIIIISAIAGVFLLIAGLTFGLRSLNRGYINLNSGRAKVTKLTYPQIYYEEYNNGLISLKIPKGWKVEIAPADYIHYSFKVYNPNDRNYMLLFGLKQEGFLKSEKARSTYAKLYPGAIFSKLSASLKNFSS